MLLALVIAVILLCVAAMVLSHPPPAPWGNWIPFALALIALLYIVVSAVRGGHAF